MTAKAVRPGQGDVEFQRRLYDDPNPTRRGLHSERRDWVLGQALAATKPGDRVIEVGVGCGIFTEALSKAGRTVDAVDVNAAFLANVETLQGVKTHLKDATLPLELGDHDLAICTEVLEHVSPDRSQAMIRALHDSLKPGGTLVLTTPQRFATVELAARLFRFKPVLALARTLYGNAEELGHINLLTAGQLRDQLQRAGFEVVTTRRFGFYLPVIAEFGGKPGAALLRGIERAVRPLPVVRGLLWTQGWALRRSIR